MSYYLIVDDENEIADLIEITLTSKFKIEVVVAYSGKEAVDVIDNMGTPELIISDYHMPNGDGLFLYTNLQNKNINCPFVICSSDPTRELKQKFPNIYGYLEKPTMIDELLTIVSGFVHHDNLTSPPPKPPYVPVRVELLLRMSQLTNDIYMKLSEDKYVKVMNKDDSFLEAESERFSSKNITHLYIAQNDCNEFIKGLQKNLDFVNSAKSHNNDSKVSLSLESLEVVERLSSVLGWTPQIVGAAKKSIQLAVNVVSNDPDIFKILQLKLNNPVSPYQQHSAPLAMITCVFCIQLGWTSDSAQMKLAMASLMHDMTIDDVCYNDIKSWNDLAKNAKEKTPQIEKYKNHPTDAAQIAQKIKHLPPDLDQIIIQHHEAPNGSGFPRGLTSSRISPMSALFIIAEDLLDFIGDEKEQLIKKLFDFVVSREQLYNEGSFKRVFQILKHHLIVSNQ